MGKLIDGVWSTNWYKNSDQGAFQRPATRFRNRLGGSEFPAAPNRYHLYVSLACPWAHRVLIARSLLGLEGVISASVVNPKMGDDGWAFEGYAGADADPAGHRFLREVYVAADAHYTGRVTVPALWDREKKTIVNNESRELMRALNDEFRALRTKEFDISPHDLRPAIDEVLDAIYEPINNGVYRTGFATSQGAYEQAFDELFTALDRWNDHLEGREFLVGGRLTEADIALFTTLYRFDPVYFGHFKCNKQQIADYPALYRFLRRMLAEPGVVETCNLDHIVTHYYWSHPSINPTRIVPKGPALPAWYKG